MNYFTNIPAALEGIKQGRMLIIVDNPNRENEGDFYIPAEKLTPQHIITMIRWGGGLICCAITSLQAARLNLPLMVSPSENREKTGVNFTVSVNAKRGVRTGVSAYERTRTIKVLVNPASNANDLVRPGHILGLVAHNRGVLSRGGHTEAAVDLARLAGFSPAGVLCEIVGKQGEMAKMPELIKLSKKLNIKMVSIKDLVKFLKVNPLKGLESKAIIKTASSTLPTKYGDFNLRVYRSFADNKEHLSLTKGTIKDTHLVRIHSQCLTGDTFFSLKCDCNEQLHQSLKMIAKKGGVILYLNQEGRGVGLSNKINAYSLQERGADTVDANLHLGLPADARDYSVACEILRDLGIKAVNLLTNNPEKKKALEKFGIKVEKMIPLEGSPNKFNKPYLLAKKSKLGHILTKV